MRVIIAGCRDIFDYELVKTAIMASDFVIDTVLCGCAPGVDTLGRQYAKEKGLKIEYYPADWEVWGKRAGPVRNTQMARKADALIAVWDGKSRGTADMIRQAHAFRLKVYVHEVKRGG